MDKHFICLANSYKRGGRCIAGVEISINQKKRWKVIRNDDGSPKWIRPIDSNTEYGEVPEDEARHIPMLSIVKLTDIKPCPHQAHSEDVFYHEITAIGTVISNAKILDILLDTVHHEIFYTTELSISPEVYAQGNYSLMMIHPNSFQFHEDPTKNRAKFRITFDHNGTLYDFSVTDPSFYLLISQQPELISTLKDIYLTLSIGLVYEGRHHKLIAGIIIPSEKKRTEDAFDINLFGDLRELSTRNFLKVELKNVRRAFVVPSQHGLSVCIKLKSGHDKFYLIEKGCHAVAWEIVNLRNALIVTYQSSSGEIVEKLRILRSPNSFFVIWNAIKNFCNSPHPSKNRH